MNKKIPFPGFPKGDFGILRKSILLTAKDFSECKEEPEISDERNKKIATILNILAEGMSDEYLYQEIYKEVDNNFDMYSNWWNREVYESAGGQIGSGQKIVADLENTKNPITLKLTETCLGLSFDGFEKLQKQLLFTESSGPLERMSFDPDFPEQLRVFNKIIWLIFMSIFYPNGINMISKIFIRCATKAKKHLA